ncbi:MAG: DNA-directed RNA polymerase subunit beta, DNA-directed RNA polymerase subunit beta [Candidatus Peregrinibacteria bacterium GW2011_GWC2_39_14]|nr:MAG: DNA-directed RNA polymerase subunit beta [Candidatus Peregrinibacteria bacterium GW2011_GWA2_38_36]KKR06872.1 MAG: DNA-directed RNA polymerase subunit beta, DNA-directed RNA polymerase subunit beta [Candidatus Peregrinibacteria bacterium GW2011_GWC2_39_14]
MAYNLATYFFHMPKKTTKKPVNKASKKVTPKKVAPKSSKSSKSVKSTKSSKKIEPKQKKLDYELVRSSTLKTGIEPLKESSHREYFSPRFDQNIVIPNLIEVQLDSYKWFINEGIKELLDEINPITDFSAKKLELRFIDHSVAAPKYDAETAKSKNITYEAPLKVHVQLINKETGEIKEQDVFLGSIPLMTNKGTFIVNGIERIVVSQLVRSPGVVFQKNPALPKYSIAKIIPKRGAWLEIETDKKGVMSVKIDRKRKIPITSLLRIMGYESDKAILEAFADVTDPSNPDYILLTLEKDPAKTMDEAYQQIYKKLRPGDLATPENAKSLIQSMFFDYKKYDMGPVARYKLNKRFGMDIKNVKENHVFQPKDMVEILKHLIKANNGLIGPDDIDHLSNRRIRAVGELVQNKFRIGLLRTERIAKDRMSVMDSETVTPTQLVNSRPVTAALREFFASSQLSQFMDQINPLAELAHKRRLSAMGPGGLSRERASFDVRDVHTSHYGRICPISTPEGPNIGLVVHLGTYARVNKYGFIETPFRTVAHTAPNKPKSLIGRTAAETVTPPKGKNPIFSAGEVITEAAANTLSKYANEIKEVAVRAYVTDDADYYDADEERELIIAQANSPLNEMKEFTVTRVSARKSGDPLLAHINDVTHIDVSSKQIISETTALIPFLEHDDNTRASMGSNMQRQAVSLICPEAPVVGTGMEEVVGRSSGQVIFAEESGTVLYADANEIVVLYDNGRKVKYEINVYERSNQATCLHQRTTTEAGKKIKKGDVLAEGASIEDGELALGQNVLVAYLSWEGYNFEDAVIISERLLKKGTYDSIHIETYTIDVRDTKLGPEIITRDIPNVGEAHLNDLDEDGIVRIGATVYEGDILVGKITPKGETELSAEERLLRAIFGDKARDVKDSSLRLPGGEKGKVIGIQMFSRKDGDELANGVNKQIRVSVAQTRKISIGDKVAGRHGNKGVISIIVPEEDMPFLADGTPVDIVLNPLGVTSRMNIGQILETHLGWAARTLDIKVATPALNGVSHETISNLLKKAGLPEDGKTNLYDGKSGDKFDHPVTVGISYILKLSHLIEDKIHARSIGPYSLVTQQPLGGKAQHGGQRFGEMEVWALEAYGAAHMLQELLTIKSDDVFGRSKAYESIIKGELIKKPRTPEGFNVLIKELQSLCLDVTLLQTKAPEEDQRDEEEYTLSEETAAIETAAGGISPEVTEKLEVLEGSVTAVGLPEEPLTEIEEK